MKNLRSNAIPVIFDTDMDCDCDDVGALAILHALMDMGEANILGVICDVPLEVSAKCALVINDYYGRSEIPIGLADDKEYKSGEKYKAYKDHRKKLPLTNDFYTEEVVKQFYDKEHDEKKIWDAVSLYRCLLARAEEKSVVIIAVGLLTALNDLLHSKGDNFSNLTGKELIKQKVKKLITMGMGRFPSCMAEFNWLFDWDAARNVINSWPTELVVSTHGNQFLTGKKLSSQTPETNPVRKSYEVYTQGKHRGNYSWDLLAALYAVRGADPYQEEINGHRLILEEELGKNHWIPDKTDKPPHVYLQLKGPRKKLRDELENLMIKPPAKKK
ncbi:MAG: hypothetical protein EU539_03100 [Promethearchaeota archaeon]|nr:MAG: hypothetical protein EU539_03100 [Candidatus Lokiarchaeota archaeon]